MNTYGAHERLQSMELAVGLLAMVFAVLTGIVFFGTPDITEGRGVMGLMCAGSIAVAISGIGGFIFDTIVLRREKRAASNKDKES